MVFNWNRVGLGVREASNISVKWLESMASFSTFAKSPVGPRSMKLFRCLYAAHREMYRVSISKLNHILA